MLDLESGLLFLFGLSIFGGIISALIFRKIKIPQVLGYIAMGIVIGQSGFRLISQIHIDHLVTFNYFALGIIGFLVGSEIKFEDMKKYGRQFSLILLGEGILAFLLVGTLVALILFKVTANFPVSLAGGLVFGAIASATDPAATINVLWEYRSAGILTTTVIAIVALDDALAMFLYGLGTSVSTLLTGENAEVLKELASVFLELVYSAGCGILTGFLIIWTIKRVKSRDTLFVLSFGLLLICIGLSVLLDLDIILAAMFAGLTVVNFIPARSRDVIDNIKGISTPIYILFFVLVGARINIGSMPVWLWIIIGAYVLFRSAGKYLGALTGAVISHAGPVVTKNIGMTLFSQGGVAIGLSIMAGNHLSGIPVADGLSLGDVIVFGVTTTTFIVQMIGPVMVKVAVRKAGEAGRDITVNDVIAEWKIMDCIDEGSLSVNENDTIRDIIKIFTESDASFVSVTDNDRHFKGIITFRDLKSVFFDSSTWDWLVAEDFIKKVRNYAVYNGSLSEAVDLMDQLHLEQLPVLSDNNTCTWLGVLDRKKIIKSARKKLFNNAA